MMHWFQRLWTLLSETQTAAEDPEIDRLRSERRRLQGMMATYSEFGFDVMAAEARVKLAELNRRIHALAARDRSLERRRPV